MKQPLQSFFFLTKILNFRISVKLHFLKPYIIATHISLACNKNYIKIEGSALCEVRQEFNGPQFTVGTSVLKLTPKLKNNKTILIKTIWFYVVLCSCFFLEEKNLKCTFYRKGMVLLIRMASATLPSHCTSCTQNTCVLYVDFFS